MEDCIPPLPPLLLRGRTRSSHTIQAQSLFFRVAPGRPSIRAAKRLHKILLVPGFHATCLASSADPEPLSNKLSPFAPRLGLNEQKPRAIGPKGPANAFGQNNFLPASPGKCTRNGNFPTGCRHSHLTYIDWRSFSSITSTG
jgi:hypothetical protein